MKCPDLHRKVIFPYLLPFEVWDQFLKKVFSKNCMKCADLHRKGIFANPCHLGVGGGVNYLKMFLGTKWYFQVCTEVIFPKPQPQRGWGQLSQKFFSKKLNAVSRSAEIFHDYRPSSLWCWGRGRGWYAKTSFLWIAWDFQICTEKCCWSLPLHGDGLE